MDTEALAKTGYLSLTTFRRDGTPVATPVWVARHGNDLVVVTRRSSGKSRRLRNDGRVLLAPCDMRGRVAGEPVEGTALLQDDAGTAVSIDLIRRRHGLIARLSFWWEDRHASASPVGNHVGIAVRVGRTDGGEAGAPAAPASPSAGRPA
jgi:PPOX class probable F420-dependent enzyme